MRRNILGLLFLVPMVASANDCFSNHVGKPQAVKACLQEQFLNEKMLMILKF
jgi:hypothetical protein